MRDARVQLPALFPFLAWKKIITRATLRKDLVAGVIGAVIVLPQGIAFATIAGLPPQYGLYAAMVPAVVAALWGSSRHLVSGPTTAISLVVFASLAPLATPGSNEYVTLAITLAFLVGILQFMLGAFRFGTLVRLISPTVVVGFTAGAGVLIAASQLKHALGIAVPQGSTFTEILSYIATHLGTVNGYALAVAGVTLITGIVVRRITPRVPYMLPAIFVGSLCAYVLNTMLGTEHTNLAMVASIPATLPPLSLPLFDIATIRELASAALAITLLGLTEAVAIARSVGARAGQHIDGNQEFIGQGLSNIAGSFFSSYPSSGSFNRSGLNFEAGAQTPLASVCAAVVLALITLLIAPLAGLMPLAVMAAVLFLVAYGIVDREHIGAIARSDRTELALLAITFLATLFIELEFAIFVGVLLALALFVRRVMFADVAEVGESHAYHTLRTVGEGSDAERYPGVLIVRIDMSIVYMNCDVVRERIARLITQREREETIRLTTLVLNFSGVNYIDLAGVEMLEHLLKDMERRNVRMGIINVKHRVRNRFEQGHLLERVQVFHNIDELHRALARDR